MPRESRPKRKFYVVWVGVRPGIYETWPECLRQVDGYPAAKYRSYPSRAEAEAAYAQPYSPAPKTERKVFQRDPNFPGPIIPSLAVDAACNMRTGDMVFRGVNTESGKELFSSTKYQDATNNVGEFLALVKAIMLLSQNPDAGYHTIPIYSDSITALAWVRHKHAKTTMPHTPRNAILWQHIHAAEEWLRTHYYKNPLLKWETRHWGETPADYGRK